MILVSGLFAAGCSGNPSSPSATGPGLTPAPGGPSPAPSPVNFTLVGRVTETAPTSRTGIGGATVSVTTDPGTGKSAKTDSLGYFTIPDVTPGSAIRVSAAGYVDTTQVSGRGTTNFQLMPVPQVRESTMSDTLSGQVGTCSDGVSMRPCHIMTIAIHNSGPLQATLTWDPGDDANLNLSLFRTGESSVHFALGVRGCGTRADQRGPG